MKQFTASVVGCGAGGMLSMKALGASPRFELVAAADIKPEGQKAAEEKFPGLKTFPSHKEMFDKCPTDIVCVSTFPPSHEEVTMDALKLPLSGILVEKPLGHTSASGLRLLNAIKERKLPMAVPHNLLAKKTPLEIIERVQNSEIGTLKLVEIQCDKWDIINAGIHWLDFFVMLTGNEPMEYVIAACDATTRTWRDGMQVETEAVTYAQTKSGVRVVMQTGDYVDVNREDQPGDILFRLIGTKGMIEFWGWEKGFIIMNAKHPGGEKIVPEEFPVTGHRLHLENMAAMIDSGKPDYSIPDSSLAALQICEGAYVSNQHRCKVTFPVYEFTPPAPVDWTPGQPYSGRGGGRDGRKLE